MEDYLMDQDYKGLMNYLYELDDLVFFEEVLKNRFSIIGNHWSKNDRVKHVLKQVIKQDKG